MKTVLTERRMKGEPMDGEMLMSKPNVRWFRRAAVSADR